MRMNVRIPGGEGQLGHVWMGTGTPVGVICMWLLGSEDQPGPWLPSSHSPSPSPVETLRGEWWWPPPPWGLLWACWAWG